MSACRLYFMNIFGNFFRLNGLQTSFDMNGISKSVTANFATLYWGWRVFVQIETTCHKFCRILTNIFLSFEIDIRIQIQKN